MILMIDHYDSFTFNLVQYFGELGQEVTVVKNDMINLEEVKDLNPDLIVLSPGPCSPDETGMTMTLIDAFKETYPIFGVCLGEQALAQAFGGDVVPAPSLQHGKTSLIRHTGDGIYTAFDREMEVMRYHSLIVKRETLPTCFEITSETKNGEVMGIRHKTLPIEGVQFHPESIGTPAGKQFIQNIITEYIH
ncbi:anthranilate synthase component II [Corticicoccus populi]|uniref:Anthranilate synthase component II n=1 Tax=Corticicoccus populi TaxID=1812821 RepID=A0ABW5WVR9_9STAP